MRIHISDPGPHEYPDVGPRYTQWEQAEEYGEQQKITDCHILTSQTKICCLSETAYGRDNTLRIQCGLFAFLLFLTVHGICNRVENSRVHLAIRMTIQVLHRTTYQLLGLLSANVVHLSGYQLSSGQGNPNLLISCYFTGSYCRGKSLQRPDQAPSSSIATKFAVQTPRSSLRIDDKQAISMESAAMCQTISPKVTHSPTVLGILMMAILVGLPTSTQAVTLPLGNCSSETTLSARTDVVFCEPWEGSNWWQTGWLVSPRLVNPIPAGSEDVALTSIVSNAGSSPCISGSCLKLETRVGVSKSISIYWPLIEAGLSPEELYFRYYIKIGPAWTPYQCPSGTGGKFPGLADRRTSSDPSGQCGNGGAQGDGINCWSKRAVFHDCTSGDNNACSTKPGAIARFGSYFYFHNQQTSTGQTAPWDNDDWAQSGSGNCATQPSSTFCGIGDGGVFLPDVWYLVEMYVKMNDVGSANGVTRGWVDGVLSYEKTNMIWRIAGHDNLHVRTVWLEIFKGGTNGNCENSEIYLDQMVIATAGVIGPWGTGVPRPLPPTNLLVQ
jgi:hypothetical protein